MPFPVADRVQTTAFHLPNHPKLTGQDIVFVAATALGVTVKEIHARLDNDN
jgi:dTDP-4-amino-4,6-dideoxygalactose transaminase